MCNIEKALYRVVRARLIEVNDDIRIKIDLYPATNEELSNDIMKINHIIDMLDIVYGAVNENEQLKKELNDRFGYRDTDM